ncbi:DUF1493 family protein [Zavarzinella formosa]|uniref:DUF1493 family protein n=1 Tax=Zavarzinella formosa TaxID=360055 RepID=UPI0002FE5C03|nr:DUF1493 family protein [Zavarzinella formosa]
MPTFEDVVALVRERTSYQNPLTAASTLQSDIGVYGDDMDDLLSAYSKRFGVDLSGYRWYFHTGEEGPSIGGAIFPPPDKQVREIPITLDMLHQFAELGRWAVEYPPHEPPRHRPDIWINFGIVVFGFVVFGFVLVAGVRRCVR